MSQNEGMPDGMVLGQGRSLKIPARPRGWPRLPRELLQSPKARLGLGIVLFFVLIALLAPLLAPGDPGAFVAAAHLEPSFSHLFGTDGSGRDVFAQTVWGARLPLLIGLATGALTTLISIVTGMAAGYFRGRLDDILSLLMNLFLVIPGVPLLLVISAYLPAGPLTIIFALAFTGWSWSARVLRAQTLALRNKDFIEAAIASGESHGRIIMREILPNMSSIIAGGLVGTVGYAIAAEAAVGMLGLTNVGIVTWGTSLFWAGANGSLLRGDWWTIVPAGSSVALVAFGLALISYGLDEITNPRLRDERALSAITRKTRFRGRSRLTITPVIRRDHGPR